MHDSTPQPNWPAFARNVIELAVRNRDVSRAVAPAHTAPHGGVFVTLKKHGHLRGCMGTLDDSAELAEAVRHAASVAATQDPRFPPVAPAELPDIAIEVSVLSKPEPMQSIDELELGKHGILVRKGYQRGLFLPQVAVEHNLDKHTFLSRCCSEKAGLPPDAWEHGNAEVLIFTADIQNE